MRLQVARPLKKRITRPGYDSVACNLCLESLIGELFRTHNVKFVDDRRVLKRITRLAHSVGVAPALEIARSRSEERRAIRIGTGTEHTHLLHKRKIAKRATKDINIFVAKSR